MSDDSKTPVERAVELLVFAPVGFARFIQTMLPGWVEAGRQEVDKQVMTAKALGGFALGQVQQEARQGLENLAGRRSAPEPATASNSAPGSSAPVPAPASAPSAASGAAPPVAAADTAATKPSATHLAIHGYDSLSASQVVERLAGLSDAELAAVGDYETATRGRRTILNKVRQLQGGTAPPTGTG